MTIKIFIHIVNIILGKHEIMNIHEIAAVYLLENGVI